MNNVIHRGQPDWTARGPLVNNHDLFPRESRHPPYVRKRIRGLEWERVQIAVHKLLLSVHCWCYSFTCSWKFKQYTDPGLLYTSRPTRRSNNGRILIAGETTKKKKRTLCFLVSSLTFCVVFSGYYCFFLRKSTVFFCKTQFSVRLISVWYQIKDIRKIGYTLLLIFPWFISH